MKRIYSIFEKFQTNTIQKVDKVYYFDLLRNSHPTVPMYAFKETSDSIRKDGRREIFRQSKVRKTQEY